MIADKVFNLLMQGIEDIWVCGHNGGFMAVAPCKVLRGNNGDRYRSRLNKNNLAVVVSKVGMFNDLRDKSPQAECLLCSFEIKQ